MKYNIAITNNFLEHLRIPLTSLIICYVLSSNIYAQQITAMEYFFDNDPGTGNATPLIIAAPADTISITATINTSGLQGGNHVLFVRAKLANGTWSLYEPREFFIKPNIIAVEYFFDADPGVGNGTSIPVTPAFDPATFISTISTTGLPGGNHNVFIRTKDEMGKWSLYQPREFFIKPNIIAAEYFFDTDPGVGNGTSIPVTPAFDPATFVSTISTTGLQGGNHNVFIRTKDEMGKWSLYQPREFFIKPNIIAAEYFFDTDPGVGNGISIPVAPALDPATFISTLNTTGLTGGNHIVFIRTKDEMGKWSLHQPREFYIRTNIIAAEYFIDTDPGVGNAIPLTISTISDTVNINATITTTLLPYGTHYIFVRTKDARNVWSLYEPHEFIVADPLPVEWISFDAVRKDADVLLTWVTGSEKNCLRFDVERMIPENGTAFYKISKVPGNGNTSVIHQYHFTDSNVKCKGTCYYRIKQIDLNGSYIFSKTIAVNFDKEKTIIKLYPNPSSQYFTLDAGEVNDIVSVEILNSNGQLITSHANLTFPFQFGSDLKAGVYLVNLKRQSESLSFKIIKEE